MASGQQYFRDYKKEQTITKHRLIFATAFVLFLMLLLVLRLFYLQVIEYERYRTKADENRLMILSQPPSRGIIYDRNGLVLADNRPIHSLTLIPEHIDDLEVLKTELAQLIDISDDEWKTYEKGSAYRRPYQSVTLKSNLTDKEWARLSVNLYKWEGVRVEAQLTRYYPYGEAFSHAIGYVGRITKDDFQDKTLNKDNYLGSLFIGKTGIEDFYEEELHGTPGYRKVEVSASGRIMAEIEQENPTTGKDIHLHLDARLQQYAYDLMGKYNGSVIVMDPETGGLLAFVSNPGFDSNLFVRGVNSSDYDKLRNSKRLPLFNRALKGGYPPASTIKPFMALAGLENGFATWSESYYAAGFYQINPNGRRYRDWRRDGHGWVDLERSIIESVDTYYYQLAHKMGITPIHDFLYQFGYGKKNILDLNGESRGLLPSNEWKKAKYGEPWYPGDSVNVGIGQGFMVATPLQIASAITAIANRGTWRAPRMAQKIGEQDIEWPADDNNEKKITLKNEAHWERVVKAMRKVITDSRGTARRLRGTRYKIAGKTGTGQLFSLQDDEEYEVENLDTKLHDHAYFTAFAPADKPKIVVFSIFENGNTSGLPADLAKKLFDAYLYDRFPKKYNYLKVSSQ
ncbi:penicillin-binding protein 2 [Marinomonas agarivorans]|nr:penicillin-binding protein 2 [Marinomonas agarivorans]